MGCRNEAGLLHHDREVLVEKGDMEATGRPDYNFRVGGQTKFYVEAKSPSEPLDTPRHIVQAKGYVWNTKSVYFVILTNFEEFRFYDASVQPDPRAPGRGCCCSACATPITLRMRRGSGNSPVSVWRRAR